MNINLNFESYAEAYRAAFAGLRGHTIDLSSGSLVYRWVDTNEVATSADLNDEDRRVNAEEQAVRNRFQMDLEAMLTKDYGFNSATAAHLYAQLMAFVGDSYECIIGDESESAYWEHLTDRARGLADLITFAISQTK